MVELTNNHICIVCDKEKEEGINVYNLFICSHCEQKIVQTEPEDPSYSYFVEKLKRMNQSTLYS
ncbi:MULTISPECIES: sigma factor G inhibitor Gin [Paraliobacillus]|uniref:sigma factor G inhibitor Gin n=1 Tax=Paraliobacillus TaxID=200903 RepID=UPI000DD46FB2|nr:MULTISPECIES: sigma factor G inhibitor Gin [Paraliobacillus]